MALPTLVERPQATHRHLIANVCLGFVVVKVCVVHLGLETSGSDGVDTDMVASEFQCQCFAHLGDTSLGLAAVSMSGIVTQPRHRRYVDDATAATGLDHAQSRALSHAPDPVEIGGQNPASIFLGDFQRAHPIADACIVEHHIDHT